MKFETKTDVFKKPLEIKFKVTNVKTEVITLEGPQTAQKGDFVLTGTKGEKWPVPRDFFESNYSILRDGVCAKNFFVVSATRKKEPFEVTPSWSDKPLKGKVGDVLVEYGPEDFGVVDWEIFLETYSIVAS